MKSLCKVPKMKKKIVKQLKKCGDSFEVPPVAKTKDYNLDCKQGLPGA